MIETNISKGYDVIIPVKNGFKFILEAIESCLKQTRPPCHILIIENNSVDGTFELVTRFIDENDLQYCVTLLRSPGNGVSVARNYGISISDAPIIAFLDADDMWERNKMELQIPLLSERSLVHSGCTIIDELNNQLAFENPQYSKSASAIYELDYPVSGSASSVICLKSDLELVGGFDEKLELAEDLDMWIRLSSLRGFVAVDAKLVRIRIHENRTQSQKSDFDFKLKEIDSLFYVLKKNAALYPNVKNPSDKILNWYILDTRFNIRFILLLRKHSQKSIFSIQLTVRKLFSVYFSAIFYIAFKKFWILGLLRRIILKLLIIFHLREYDSNSKDLNG